MKINAGQAPSTLVPKYIGSDYDKVKSVADNMETVTEVVDNLDHIKTVESNLGSINTVTDNITDIVTVSGNIDYVKDVAEGIEGLPVVSYIGDKPPTQPLNGAEWYCTTDGRTYVWYTDADSGQWVENNPQSTIETDPSIAHTVVINTDNIFALWKRSAAEAGLNLVAGSFEEGGVLTSSNDVLLHKESKSIYAWSGAFPHSVVKGTDPTLPGSGYVSRMDAVLRNELTSGGASINDIAQLPAVLSSTSGAESVITSSGQSLQGKINEFELLKPYQTAAQVAKTFQSGSRPVISCYGDSTMWGATVGNLGAQDVNNPPASLAMALNMVYSGAGFTVNNRAISGTTLRQMLAGTDGSGSTFISKISAGGVDASTKIIYCNHCINDSQLNGDVDQYREDLIYFVNSCRAANKVPILATANPNPALLIINEEKSKRLYYYVETMRDVAKKMGCDLVDQFMYFEASTNYIRIDNIVPDGAHLSPDAYKQAGFNLAIPLVCCRTIGDYGDSAGLENTTYFDNLSVNRQIQYRGGKTGGILTADRPASGIEGVNYPVIFSKGQKCFSILGLQWPSAANAVTTIDRNFAGTYYMQKQFGNQSSLKWDCESKYYGNFFAGLHVISLLFDSSTPGIGNGLTLSGVSIPKLYESSQNSATAQADPYTKHVIATRDTVHINSVISDDGYKFCDNSGSTVVRIWINSGVLTLDLYKNGSVVQTGTAGSSLTSNVFAPMQLQVDDNQVTLSYGTLGIVVPITSPIPNMKGYTALMQYHVAPTFGV